MARPPDWGDWGPRPPDWGPGPALVPEGPALVPEGQQVPQAKREALEAPRTALTVERTRVRALKAATARRGPAATSAAAVAARMELSGAVAAHQSAMLV